MTAPHGAGGAASPGPTPTKPSQFNMAAHRKWFGKVCGANGTATKELIQRMEA